MTLTEHIAIRDLDDIKMLADGEIDYTIYYADAEKVYENFRDEIWGVLVDTAKVDSPELTPISLMSYSRAACHEQFVTDLVNYVAMEIARCIIEEIKQSKKDEHILWVHKNYFD